MDLFLYCHDRDDTRIVSYGARMLMLQRLGTSDRALARAAFAMMAEVFEHPPGPLGDAYLDKLLARPELWAIAAIEQGEVVGVVTAHALAMTHSESTELFIYDLAVRTDRQRRGIGRTLMQTLITQAAAAGITVSFVPADDEDTHALDFYRAIGGEGAAVTIFTFTGPGVRT
jgi:aminoglycoside 3-N-acetyltransferase I